MRKMKIVVVDSGINIDTEAGKCVKFAYTIKRNPNTMEWEAVLEDSIDTFWTRNRSIKYYLRCKF